MHAIVLLALVGSSAVFWMPAPCDGADVDPWITGLRDRTVSFNALARYAIDRYGPVRSCEGAVTTEFDGQQYGFVRLAFADSVAFEIETMPPETSIVTLRHPHGFEDGEGVRRTLEAYAAGVGLRIDWTTPTTRADGDERVETFSDPDPGMNGSVSFVSSGDALLVARLSMAL